MRTNDDMDISPNSSPLSDSCSNACSNSKSQSPQRHLAPTPYSFQKPFICNSRPPSTNCHDILSKTDKASSTLCQLVDAIRASIDGFLDQSPKSTLQLVDRVYPLMNGTYSTKSGELTKSNPSITSVVDSRLLKNHEHLQISSNKINSPDLLHNHMHSRERNSNSLHSDHNSSCTYSPKLSNSTVINIRANSKVNPVLDFPKPSVTHCPSLARPSTMTIDQRRVLTGVTRSTLQNNSPTIISPLNSSTTTSSNISVPFQTSSQACVVSSHQMNDLLDILAHKDPQYVRNRIEEKSPKTYLISNNHCTQNSRENASPETDFRGVHTHTSASHDPTSNRQANDAGSAGARSQNTQLNDLVQVLKVALQQTNQSQSSASSSSRTFNSRVAVPPLHEILRTPSVDQKHRLYKESSISSKDYFHKQQSIIGSQNRFGSVDNCQPNSDPILLDTLKSPISERINTHDNTNIVGNVGIHSAPNYPIVSPTSNSPPVIGTSDSVMMMKKRSPSVQQEKVDVDVEILSISLDSSEMRAYCEPMLTLKYYDDSLQRLEQEAHMEAKNFDRLQSVLYAELSAESKKLRALVRISEAKLAIHKEKQSALQELMDAIEVRKHLPNLSFVDDVL